MSSSALVSAIVILMIGLPITRAPAITIQVHSMVTYTKWSNENHGGTSFFRYCTCVGINDLSINYELAN